MINQSEQHKCDRQFRWMSSVTGDTKVLSVLNQQMSCFYGQAEGRELYQKMLDTIEDNLPSQDSVRHLMPKYICDLKPESVLEIGCANGRLYRQLRSYGYTGTYSGIEVADYIIEKNKLRHPEAVWRCANVYEIPFPDNSFNICFSLYVLEHLVYPERALREMLRVVKPNGSLILVFPDFVELGRFPSQQLGFSPAITASKKLQSGKFIDALVSLYDSRVRLPKILKTAVSIFGSFPVNTRPLCLSYSSVIGTDVDAVYIASKHEVYDWAFKNGYQVDYPCGVEGEFAVQAFMAVRK